MKFEIPTTISNSCIAFSDKKSLRQFSTALSFLVLACSPSFAQSQLGEVNQILNTIEKKNSATISPFSSQKPKQLIAEKSTNFTSMFEVTLFHDKDGVIVIGGHAKGNRNSKMHLRGTRSKLDGKVFNRATGEALVLSTDHKGMLVSRPVPIAKLIPDLSPKWGQSIESAKRNLRQHERRLRRLDLNSHQWIDSELVRAQSHHVRPFAGQDLLTLESKPGAKKVIYLNFTHPDRDELKRLKLENELPVLQANGSPNPINVAIKEIDDTTKQIGRDKFINVEKADIYKVWQIVSSQYASFDVNITTNRDLFLKTEGADRYEVMFFNHGCRSYADLDAFGTDSSPAHMCVDSDQEDSWALGVGYTAAHEIGHGLGLQHQGDPGDNYSHGIASFQWVPIMGNFWHAFDWEEPLVQFTKGEYKGAVSEDLNYLQDDRAVILRYLPVRSDDNSAMKNLTISNQLISPSINFGVIESSEDKDTFNFRTDVEGELELHIAPIEVASMLDVAARIVDNQGKLIAEASSALRRDVKFERLQLKPGNYKVEIRGGAEGTPSEGFSSYSSTGYYALSGKISSKENPIKIEQTILNTENLAASKGAWKYFSVQLPAGSTGLFVLSSGTGDADLYVKKGSKPQGTSSIVPPQGCSSDAFNTNEKCFVKNTGASMETYHIGIFAYKDYQGVALKVTTKR